LLHTTGAVTLYDTIQLSCSHLELLCICQPQTLVTQANGMQHDNAPHEVMFNV